VEVVEAEQALQDVMLELLMDTTVSLGLA